MGPRHRKDVTFKYSQLLRGFNHWTREHSRACSIQTCKVALQKGGMLLKTNTVVENEASFLFGRWVTLAKKAAKKSDVMWRTWRPQATTWSEAHCNRAAAFWRLRREFPILRYTRERWYDLGATPGLFKQALVNLSQTNDEFAPRAVRRFRSRFVDIEATGDDRGVDEEEGEGGESDEDSSELSDLDEVDEDDEDDEDDDE